MSILTYWFRLIQNFPRLLTDSWHKNSATVSISHDNEKNVNYHSQYNERAAYGFY